MRLFADRPIPLASFASVMGIAGLGLVWHAQWIIAVGAAVFAVLLVAWIVRCFRHPQEIADELHVAITASFLSTITISCNLLAAGFVEWAPGIAMVLWVAGALGGVLVLLYLLGHWIEFGIPEYELTPALFIPIVGNATTAFAAVALGQAEIGWAAWAIAAICWIAILPIVTYRLLVVQPRLPRLMAPQLSVYVASPAVMASAWFVLTGAADPVFKILAFKALFFALVTLRLWRMAWGAPFNVAMWGYTFPAAALAGAFARAAHAIPTPLYTWSAVVTLWLATAVVAACVLWTLMGWVRDLAKSISSAGSSRSSPAG